MKSRKPINRLASITVMALLLLLLLAACGQSETAEEPESSEQAAESADAPSEPGSDDGEPVVIDSGGEVPFYARFGENETFGDGEWTVIVFYRSPDCIPAEFNLNQFFDFPSESGPGAFGCSPPTTAGIETWENGPEEDPAPLIAETTGRGAVPVWFIAAPEMKAAMADGEVTIGELVELPSRLVGTASTYEELLHPGQSNEQSLVQFVAEGTLDDGGTFTVDVSAGASDVEDHVTIDISG